ncbi:MAG: MFS transporter [Candidatus Eremiobacteraeota bacterium]|nr:MFS transporter [Candidatus Eremiobacteraeota bacterium]
MATTETTAGASVATRSSRKRYAILAILCLLYFISYLDRVTISVTAPKIIDELHFSKTSMGLIFSAFAISYALLQIVGGVMGDRFGPRKVLSALMGWWSFFTILTGFATSVASFFIVRLLFGVGEAGGFPVATRALATWYPPTMRGFLQGITHAASRSGAAFAPPIVVGLVVLTGGWRPPFVILGALGVLWSVLFFAIYRDNPADDASVNALELEKIGTRTAVRTDSKKHRIPWGTILRNRDVWLLTAVYFAYGYTLWIYLTWLPTYLKEARHFTFSQLGIAASLPLIGGVLGDLIGGTLSDKIYERTGNLNLARRSVIAVAYVGSAAFTVPSAFVGSSYAFVLLSAGALFMLECAVSNCWAVSMDLGGRYYAGTVSGIMNTGFGVAGIISPFVFGYLADTTGGWTTGFMLGSGILLLGALTIVFTDATNTCAEPVVA